MVPAVSVHAVRNRAAEEPVDPELPVVHFHHPAAAAVSAGQREHPVDAVPGAGEQSAADLPPEGQPAFPSEEVSSFVPAAAVYADALPCPVADSGNSGCAVNAADLSPGTCRRYNDADTLVEVHGRELLYDSIYPIPGDYVPSHYPSAGPSVAGHLTANHENRPGAAGNSGRECAE